MAKIPLHVKVSLLNNYIQSDILKSRGKATHEDWPIGAILNSIKEDIQAFEKEHAMDQEQGVSMELILRDLKYYNEKQTGLRKDISSILEQLQEIYDTQTEPEVNLNKIIQDLEEKEREK